MNTKYNGQVSYYAGPLNRACPQQKRFLSEVERDELPRFARSLAIGAKYEDRMLF